MYARACHMCVCLQCSDVVRLIEQNAVTCRVVPQKQALASLMTPLHVDTCYMYIYIYTYIHTYIYTYICIYIERDIDVDIHTHIHTCVYL